MYARIGGSVEFSNSYRGRRGEDQRPSLDFFAFQSILYTASSSSSSSSPFQKFSIRLPPMLLALPPTSSWISSSRDWFLLPSTSWKSLFRGIKSKQNRFLERVVGAFTLQLGKNNNWSMNLKLLVKSFLRPPDERNNNKTGWIRSRSESFSKWNISILTVDYVSIARLSISFLKRVYP